jgi:hypothetical protein
VRATGEATRALGLACLVATLLACRSLIPDIRVPGFAPEITEDELHADVIDLANAFASGVTAAADEISASSPSRTERRRALLWKVRMIPLAQEAALSGPREGYVELLVLCVAQRQYLTDGAGASLFGERQEIARSAALRLEAGALSYASRLLPRERAAALAGEAEALAKERPIVGEFAAASLHRAFADVSPGARFDWVFRLPMAPFRAFEGVESGAQAIHEFNATARQLGDLAARLPELTRWQLELFLYDLEDRETTMRGLEAFERLSASAERLPAATREELERLLEESTAAQQELRTTLDALRQASASIDGTLANAQPLADALERVAGRANEAGATWNELVARFRPEDRGEEEPQGRPFDITEYERTAAGVRDAAVELRALLDALRAGQTSLADTLLWRGLALLVAFFALLLVSRAISARWLAAREPRR